MRYEHYLQRRNKQLQKLSDLVQMANSQMALHAQHMAEPVIHQPPTIDPARSSKQGTRESFHSSKLQPSTGRRINSDLPPEASIGEKKGKVVFVNPTSFPGILKNNQLSIKVATSANNHEITPRSKKSQSIAIQLLKPGALIDYGSPHIMRRKVPAQNASLGDSLKKNLQLIKSLNVILRQSTQMGNALNRTATNNNNSTVIIEPIESTRNSPKQHTSSKYLRIRTKAEEEAKRHIDKLNMLMDKRLSKEKKVESNLKDLTKERLYKFGMIEDKRQQARQKAYKQQSDMENQSMKSYASSLKDLRLKQQSPRPFERQRQSMATQSRSVLAIPGGNKHYYDQQNTTMSSARSGGSIHSFKQLSRQEDAKLQESLDRVANKLQRGFERSQQYKTSLAAKASQHIEFVKSKQRVGQSRGSERDAEAWANCVLHRQKIVEKAADSQKLRRELVDQQKAARELKHHATLMQRTQETNDGSRFKQYMQKMSKTAKRVEEVKERNSLERLKKAELQYNRRILQRDNLQEIRLKGVMERNLLIHRHQIERAQRLVGKDEVRRDEMQRRVQEVERVRMTHGKNPYQEMQTRYLSNSLLFKSQSPQKGQQQIQQEQLQKRSMTVMQ
ncbi:hypothetical protein FGO68_gene14045 [Halteria grandinella]|uniref:Uncharacterized protein n=1 Tax=Halteria grandinella TaxID=5974 RepID=A0A8J8T6X4_HALGN|nr:hypothetical protein FGO68_gene14045 [Halteria grandinella]